MSRELHEAAAENDLNTLVALLDKGVDINSLNPYNGTALMIAAKRGHQRIVAALLARGANPRMTLCPPRDSNQTYTALHTAAQEGHNAICDHASCVRGRCERGNRLWRDTPGFRCGLWKTQ
jgi:ankyrin repeat protein